MTIGRFQPMTVGHNNMIIEGDAPCIVYNLNGYYDSLKVLLDHMIEMGLSTSDKQEKIYFANNLSEIDEILTDTNE